MHTLSFVFEGEPILIEQDEQSSIVEIFYGDRAMLFENIYEANEWLVLEYGEGINKFLAEATWNTTS